MTQNNRQFHVAFDLGQGHALDLHAHDFIDGPESINGVFEEAFRRGLVKFLAMIKIVFNVLDRERFWALLVVQCKMCQASEVIVQGAFCFAIDRKALLQFVLKRTESRYLLKGAFSNGFTFFYT